MDLVESRVRIREEPRARADSREERGYGPGVVAFGLDGKERWRLRTGEYRWMDAAGSVGYLHSPDGSGVAEVVDLVTGEVLGELGFTRTRVVAPAPRRTGIRLVNDR